MRMDIPSCPVCGRPVEIRGYCYAHYNAARKSGALPRLTADDRFWMKVEPTGFCWNWTGATKETGHGHLRRDGRFQQAHRVAYELLVGPIPEGAHLDHLCRNPACVNPDHVEPVAPRVNYMRGYSFSGVNHRKVRCPAGHEYDERNTYVDSQGQRHCRACGARRAREARERRKAATRSEDRP